MGERRNIYSGRSRRRTLVRSKSNLTHTLSFFENPNSSLSTRNNLQGRDYKATDVVNYVDGQNYALCFLPSPVTHTSLAPTDNKVDLAPFVLLLLYG